MTHTGITALRLATLVFDKLNRHMKRLGANFPSGITGGGNLSLGYRLWEGKWSMVFELAVDSRKRTAGTRVRVTLFYDAGDDDSIVPSPFYRVNFDANGGGEWRTSCWSVKKIPGDLRVTAPWPTGQLTERQALHVVRRLVEHFKARRTTDRATT